MKPIDININRAKIKSVNVEFGEDMPNVQATISLFAGAEKEVTTFTLGTRKYFNDTEFELPIGMIPTIKRIGEQMEDILIRQCQKELAQLAAPVAEEVKPKSADGADSQYVDLKDDWYPR